MSKRCKYCGNGDRLDLEYAIKDLKPTDDVVCANMSNCRERMNGIINLVHSELDRRIRQHMDDYRDYEETCKELEQARAEVERLKADLIDRDKALEIARKEIGRLSFELDEMTEHSDHERKVAKTEIARMRTITEHAEKVVELYEKIRRMEAAHRATDNSKQVFKEGGA